MVIDGNVAVTAAASATDVDAAENGELQQPPQQPYPSMAVTVDGVDDGTHAVLESVWSSDHDNYAAHEGATTPYDDDDVVGVDDDEFLSTMRFPLSSAFHRGNNQHTQQPSWDLDEFPTPTSSGSRTQHQHLLRPSYPSSPQSPSQEKHAPSSSSSWSWWSSPNFVVAGGAITSAVSEFFLTSTNYISDDSSIWTTYLTRTQQRILNESTGLTLSQQKVLAIVPKFTSAISIPCSCFIIYEVIQDHKRKRATAIKRALLGMSCIDVLASSAWFLSTWAVPESSGFAFARGNMASCNYQGFLLQLAVGAPLYNSSLALFYLLMIKNRWTTAHFDKSKIEWYVHGFILTFSIGTSILLLFLKQYNHIQAVCWVIGLPQGCGNSSYQPNPDVPCVRGDYAWAYGLGLFYGPLWICVVACTASMFILYNEVRKTHLRSRRYTSAIQGMQHSTNRSGQDTTRVAIQAILYSLSFVITWMPSTIWCIAHWFNWGHYGLDLFAASTEPLQGFWNLMIFLLGRRRIPQLCKWLFPCYYKHNLSHSPEASALDNSSSRHRRGHGNHPVTNQRQSIESMLRSLNRSQRSSNFDATDNSCILKQRTGEVIEATEPQDNMADSEQKQNLESAPITNNTLHDALTAATALVKLEEDDEEVDDDDDVFVNNTGGNSREAGTEETIEDVDSQSTSTPNSP